MRTSPHWLWMGIVCAWASLLQAQSPLLLKARDRIRWGAGKTNWAVREAPKSWNAARTAVVVCDMWDKHHCPDATERVGEMAPRMNELIGALRAKGCLVIHCPSDTMDFYKDHPGRALARSAPKVDTRVPLEGWCSLKPEVEGALPIDDSDGGCDGCPDCPSFKAWTRQHPAIEIRDGDAITDSAEAYYLMRQRGITNVLVMGVHINMCVLGRPFSIRQMVRQGQNVMLVRDMTDSMYNHRKAPYVSHFRGTSLVVEHIEKFWCPSTTSADVLGGEPFRFRGERTRRVALVLGENEYRTWETLPAFAREHLGLRGFEIDEVRASEKEGDGNFENWEALRAADLVVMSVRRRPTPPGMMSLLRAHVAAGKPLVAIRTSSHAFQPGGNVPAEQSWPSFDEDILGAKYQGHYGKGPGRRTVVRQVTETASHPVLTGVDAEGVFESHLYRSRSPYRTVTPLLVGRTEDGMSEPEPVAWVNTRDNRRVFYTSLGSPEDFAKPMFRRLLLNGILWAMDEFIPPAPKANAVAPASAPGASATPSTPAASPSASAAPATAATVASSKPAPGPAGPLKPSEAAGRFEVAPGLAWDLVLAEPDIAQPVFATFDEIGRLWVVEYRQYPHPAGLKMVSRDNFWRAVYDRVPPPPPNHFKGLDRISVHEDRDGDGVMESHKVFVDGLSIATSVAFGRGGVWVLNPPYLLFYADRNADDVPDGDPEVRLSGFGLEDTHSVANSLRWGPDGWLYGCQGSTVTGNIRVHGADGRPLASKPVYSQGQNIWRYHPERRVYEVFSEGGGNAFGLEIDSAGRVFSGHNGGNTRGFHYLQGAYLQKGFDKHGPLSNPHAYGYFPAMAHPDVDRFTHTFVIEDSGGLGAGFAGRLFGVEPLQGRIVMSEVTREGSTFRTRDVGHAVQSSDPWFRPVDIKLGPDGALYVCDWYDRQVNHYRNHEGQVDPSNGRIYRLRATEARPGRMPSLRGAKTGTLVATLGHTNRFLRQTALRMLADRREAGAVKALEERIEGPALAGPDVRLEALWALWQLGALDEARALRWLGHEDPQVRAWVVRWVGDARQAGAGLSARLAAMALSEPDVEVRAQLACSARRLPPAEGLPVVRGLLMNDADARDPRQPLLLWWAVEGWCASDREAVLGVMSDRELWRAPLVQGHLLGRLARRWAATGTSEDSAALARLFRQAPDAAAAALLMKGVEEATRGRSLPALPESLVAAMEASGAESLLVGLRRGKPETLDRALAMVADEKLDAGTRVQLVQVLGETRAVRAVPTLLALARDGKNAEVRSAAVGALQAHEDPTIAADLVAMMASLPTGAKAAAWAALGSRPSWALVLLRAVKSGSVPAAAVPMEVARRLKGMKGDEVARWTSEIWPTLRQATTSEMEREIGRLVEVVGATTGNPYPGKKLFTETCGGCHRLFGKGGEVGPDLTTYQRTDLGNLVLSIVNPGAEIREGYESFVAETKDGRSLAGFVLEKDAQRVVLRTTDGRAVALGVSEVAAMEPLGGSLMPEGLLAGLTDQQVRDLFAYLRSTQPLND